MKVQHYEFILIKEIDTILEKQEEIGRKDLIHLRGKLAELIKQNDRYAMLYHLSAKEVLDDSDTNRML